MDTILVRAEPKFADLIPVFLQNCRKNVIAMLDALDRVTLRPWRFWGTA